MDMYFFDDVFKIALSKPKELLTLSFFYINHSHSLNNPQGRIQESGTDSKDNKDRRYVESLCLHSTLHNMRSSQRKNTNGFTARLSPIPPQQREGACPSNRIVVRVPQTTFFTKKWSLGEEGLLLAVHQLRLSKTSLFFISTLLGLSYVICKRGYSSRVIRVGGPGNILNTCAFGNLMLCFVL